jgi:hypothetical protein
MHKVRPTWRDRSNRLGQDGDVIGGGVRPRLPGAQHAREELLGVATRPQRVESEGPLERLVLDPRRNATSQKTE